MKSLNSAYPVIIKQSEYRKYIFPKGKAGPDFLVMKTETKRIGRHYEAILLAIKKLASEGKAKFENDYAGDLIIGAHCDKQAEIIKLSNKGNRFELLRVGPDSKTKSTEDIPVEMASENVDAEDRVEKMVKML